VSGGLIVEEIAWIAVADELPDSDTTVLIACSKLWSEPVWMGWHAVDATPLGPDIVIAWADMPAGPA
jgi:hypothetical protein